MGRLVALFLVLYFLDLPETTNARKHQNHTDVEDRLKHLETIQRLSHRKILSLEHIVDTQGDIIRDLVGAIKTLDEVVNRQKVHIVNLSRRARHNKQKLLDVTKELKKTSSFDTSHTGSQKAESRLHQEHASQHSPHVHSQHTQHGGNHHQQHNQHHHKTPVLSQHPSNNHQTPQNSEKNDARAHNHTSKQNHNHHHGSNSGNHHSHVTNNPHHHHQQQVTKVHQDGHATQAHKHHSHTTTTSPVTHRLGRRQGFGGIAFTAYLDHDTTLGGHQTLKFNKVILNDGDGYNNHTGVFTCSEAGVYMFTFFIGQRDEGHYMWAELFVNSVNVIDAVVDTYHPSQDLQGGNTVVIRLKAGDLVWIDATHSGSHVEGSGNLRLSSFTGLFLYS